MPLSLSVVFLPRNVTRRALLGRADPSSFPSRDDSVRLCFILHMVDAVLLPLKAIGLPLVELAAGDSSIDPLFLIHLALIDNRGLGLREGRTARQDKQAPYCDQHLFHPCLLK
jgi:hypothetical protein